MNVAESRAVMLTRKKQLWATCHERDLAVRQIQDTLDQIDVTRQALQHAEADANAVAVANAAARNEWKALQKRNTQKKTVLEMAFNVQITNEQSCTDLLERQAVAMQEDHEREHALDDQILDLTAQVKQSYEVLEQLRQDATRQAEDVHILEQTKKYAHLNEIMQWYIEMQALVTHLTGLRVLRVEASHFDVQVGDFELRMVMDPDSIKLQQVQLTPPTLDIADLVEIAVDENDVPFLLRETQARVVNMAQLQAHLDFLATEGVTCTRNGMNVSLKFGAPDEEMYVEVEVSTEYALDHEWLQVLAVRPANERLMVALNTTVQCRNLVDLIREIVHQLLQ
ncbi:hypothetical protein, variant [Aphanomyces astaci]|nr:hypothetical protein, variant [Aphanomyces astaci]ETV81303.1 hypothetical protein, variant [Aphanomyces astaci]|eukprot:XP_009829161.1 hypothetical protein, variant [Aphanomyces astaci]